MNTNSLPNHATSSISINMLETEGLRSLTLYLDRIYKMLVEARYKKDSYEDGLISRDFYMYHQEKGHMINQCKDFCNEGQHAKITF
jgi:hypothetical protein